MKHSIGRRVGALETKMVSGSGLPAIVFIGMGAIDCRSAEFNGQRWVRAPREAIAEFQARVMKDWSSLGEGVMAAGCVAFGPTFS